MTAFFIALGPLIISSLSAAITIITGSFFLYSFTKDIQNRVARAFSILLFFVTITYIGDLGVTYSDSSNISSAIPWLTFQWIGIAFVPAAYLHLSDAILTMTGVASRGRRRMGIYFVYGVATIFFALVVWTEWVVLRHPSSVPAPHFKPGAGFWLFLLYFVSAVILGMWFVIRARRRSLTRTSRRRMNYLLIAYFSPALAVFPFLLISGQGLNSLAIFYAVLVIVDVILCVMLTFMAYTLAFFGTGLPDRLVKAQMLQFFLRGPVVGIGALAVILWIPGISNVLGLSGEAVMPFLAVVAILSMQWLITMMRPRLERFLIYRNQQEMQQIQELESRLITEVDFIQLLDTLLAATCDYLQVKRAFILSLTGEVPKLEQEIRLSDDDRKEIEGAAGLSPEVIHKGLTVLDEMVGEESAYIWKGFWLFPLYITHDEGTQEIGGVLGVAKPKKIIEIFEDEDWAILMEFISQAAKVLEDRHIQTEVLNTLASLIPDLNAIQEIRSVGSYRGRVGQRIASDSDLTKIVKKALSHYWGGENLTHDTLMNLQIVQQSLKDNDDNPQRSVRSVLLQAIEKLRPDGERSMMTTEWTFYNILEMRFVQGRKVRDVAMRLAMSEADFYRKQRSAIESVSQNLIDMERAIQSD